MATRLTSPRSKAEHYRELAFWTSDERTYRTLIDMARELEANLPPRGESPPPSLPRALN
jgi:hypothetical protein